MKYLITIILASLLISVNAQQLIYGESFIEKDEQRVQTISVTLEPSVSDVKDSFKKWVEDSYDVDLGSKKLIFFDKEYMTAKGIKVPSISKNKIDLYIKVDETNKEQTILHAFASKGYDNYIDPQNHPYEYEALRDIIYEYVSEYLPEYYDNQVKETKEEMANLNDKEEDYIKELEETNGEIDKLKEERKEILEKLKNNQSKMNKLNADLKLKKHKYQEINKRVSDIK